MVQADLPLERYLAIVDRHVSQYGVPRVISLQGEGEPTLNKYFFEMAAYARSIGSEPYTITNGTYRYPERFKKNFTRIGVSIDTLDAEEASRIGRHNLSRTIEFVLALSGELDIAIHSVATSPSAHDVAIWSKEHGMSHIMQELQSKDDFSYRYRDRVTMHPRPQKFRCRYVEQPLVRYVNLEEKELPCVYIKDTQGFVSVADLRQRLARRETPSCCLGCRELK